MSEYESNTLASEQSTSLAEYVGALKRRKRAMMIVGGLVMVLVLLAAFLWPPTYSSSATILIEEQEIPQDMVRTTITSYATEQIEVIRQRVLTLQNVMRIVEKHSLYSQDDLDRMTQTEIARDFIDAVSLDLLHAEVIDPRSGRPTQATIAFTLGFSAKNPKASLKITNELVNLFLNEHLRNRREKAASTSDFLRQETESLQQEVENIEAEIARYKSEQANALPDSQMMNLQNLSRYQNELLNAEARLNAINTELPQLRMRLSSISAYAPTVLPSGESVLADVDRLKALQSEYRMKSARYSDNHPDLVTLRREIDALAAEVGHAGDRDELLKLLANRRTELAALQSKYESDHPDIVAQRQLVEKLADQIDMLDQGELQVTPDNPAYLILDNQIKAFESEKAGLVPKLAQLNDQIQALSEAAARAPAVEQRYNELVRSREVTTAKYMDLLVKLKEAELAGELEEGRMAQRFTLIDPPTLPEEPVSPNRLAIIIIGVMLAAGAGMGSAFLFESLDQGIYSVRSLGDAIGTHPLATIPYLETPSEQLTDNPSTKIFWLLLAGVVAAAILLLLVHNFYKPLDVLWFIILRKLGLN